MAALNFHPYKNASLTNHKFVNRHTSLGKSGNIFSYFDQTDFFNRNVKVVCQAYLSDWFAPVDGSGVGFYIPVVGAIGNRTDFIGTRHRLAVLLPHMEELPIAFAMAHLSPVEYDFFCSIPSRPLDPLEFFWIPDFPILDALCG